MTVFGRSEARYIQTAIAETYRRDVRGRLSKKVERQASSAERPETQFDLIQKKRRLNRVSRR